MDQKPLDPLGLTFGVILKEEGQEGRDYACYSHSCDELIRLTRHFQQGEMTCLGPAGMT